MIYGFLPQSIHGTITKTPVPIFKVLYNHDIQQVPLRFFLSLGFSYG